MANIFKSRRIFQTPSGGSSAVDAVTNGDMNPVTSNAVFDALAAKATIYTADGTLSGNRTLSMSTYSLTFNDATLKLNQTADLSSYPIQTFRQSSNTNILKIGTQSGGYPMFLGNEAQMYLETSNALQVRLNGSNNRFEVNKSGLEVFQTAYNGVSFIDNTTCFTVGGASNLGGKFNVKGSGSTSATTTALFQNSSGTELFKIKDDGTFYFKAAGNNSSTDMLAGSQYVLQYGNENFSNIALGNYGSTIFDPAAYSQTVIGGGSRTLSGAGTILGAGNTIPASSGYATVIGVANAISSGYSDVIRIGTGVGFQTFGGNSSMHFGEFAGASVAALNADEISQFYFGDRTPAQIGRGNGTWGLVQDDTHALSYVYSNATADTQLGTGGNTLVVANHTSNPSTNLTDKFQLYSKDIVAGNACPHIRTENGDIIKLFANDNTVTPATRVGGGGTTITDTDTFGGFTIAEIAAALIANGLLK
jgi:hypothetical protein